MKYITSILLFCILLFSSCKEEESNPIPPPEEQPQINLSLEDASCTEAWIKLSTSSLALPSDIDLYRDSSLVETINLTSEDTVLYVDSLLPNHTYKYQTVIQSTGQSGNQLSVNTMDTTSHNRSWEVFYFGDYSHSSIRDIAIISENDIWAVGEIYISDTTQNGYTAYNAVHWDGSQWELKRVYFPTICGSTSLSSYPARSIFAFDDGDIWISSTGDKIAILRDGVQINKFCMPWSFSINKIWGTSSNDIYIVGYNGKIAHHQNSNWSIEESGTTVDLLDIWGGSDGTLWSCGHTGDYNTSVLLRNTGFGWEKIYEGNSETQNNGYQIGPINGIWGTNEFRIYMVNKSGLYIQPNSSELILDKEIVKTSYFSFSADGTDDNNIYISGEWFVGHWNGVSYREYPVLYKQFRKYYSIKVKGNTVCAGGTDYNGPIFSQAVIVLSK